MLKLFLFTDDVEEFLISAINTEDAFNVIEEKYGADAADELIGSKLITYPDEFILTENGQTAKEVAAKGRRIIEDRDVSKQKRIIRP